MMLPGLSGLEVCRLRRAKATTPILVLAAHAEMSLKVRALDLGADDYLTKPFAAEEKFGHRTYSRPGARFRWP